MGIKKITATERKFAARMVRRAAAQAKASGDIFSHTRILWNLMVNASNKARTK